MDQPSREKKVTLRVEKRRPYQPPRLTFLGDMAKVTAKSGANVDQNQVTKMGGGGG